MPSQNSQGLVSRYHFTATAPLRTHSLPTGPPLGLRQTQSHAHYQRPFSAGCFTLDIGFAHTSCSPGRTTLANHGPQRTPATDCLGCAPNVSLAPPRSHFCQFSAKLHVVATSPLQLVQHCQFDALDLDNMVPFSA